MMRIFPLSAALALAGCGLSPVYQGGAAGPVATTLATIEVGPIPDKAGWLVRNALVDRLGGGGASSRYKLEVELDDQVTAFGIRRDTAATRERRTLRARYRLVERSNGQVVLDATAGADAGIDVVSSQYATVAAEQTALERLSQGLADQISARLAQFARAR